MRTRTRSSLLAATIGGGAILAGALLVPSVNAGASTFPGTNGLITFSTRSGEGDTEIVTVAPDGSGYQEITDNGDDDNQPSWSADGSMITFARAEGGLDTEIWVMDADGSNQTQVTDDGDDDTNPSFSPDGTQIVFSRNMGEGGVRVMRIEIDGTDDVELTDGSVPSWNPTYSPDGSQIAFLEENAERTVFSLAVMDADGSDVTTVVEEDSDNPCWAADGASLLYEDPDPYQGWAYDVATATSNPVVNGSVEFYGGCFSPDGGQVTFRGQGDVDEYGIWVAAADGSDPTLITTDSNLLYGAPDWQPIALVPVTTTTTQATTTTTARALAVTTPRFTG